MWSPSGGMHSAASPAVVVDGRGAESSPGGVLSAASPAMVGELSAASPVVVGTLSAAVPESGANHLHGGKLTRV